MPLYPELTWGFILALYVIPVSALLTAFVALRFIVYMTDLAGFCYWRLIDALRCRRLKRERLEQECLDAIPRNTTGLGGWFCPHGQVDARDCPVCQPPE